MRFSIVAILLLLSAAVPEARAEKFVLKTTLKNESIDFEINSGDYVRGTLNLDADIYMRVSTIFGDPVWYCSIRWRFNSLKIKKKSQSGYVDANYIEANDISEKLLNTIEIYNVKLAYNYSMKPVTGFLCDAGIPRKSGSEKFSFQIPESSDWKDFLIYNLDDFKRAVSGQKLRTSFDASYWAQTFTKDELKRTFDEWNNNQWLPQNMVSILKGDVNVSSLLWKINNAKLKKWSAVKRQEGKVEPGKKRVISDDAFDNFFKEGIDDESELEKEENFGPSFTDKEYNDLSRTVSALSRQKSRESSSLNRYSSYIRNKSKNCNINLDMSIDRGFETFEKCKSPLERYYADNKCGYKDFSGRTVISAKYSNCDNFNGKYALAKTIIDYKLKNYCQGLKRGQICLDNGWRTKTEWFVIDKKGRIKLRNSGRYKRVSANKVNIKDDKVYINNQLVLE